MSSRRGTVVKSMSSCGVEQTYESHDGNVDCVEDDDYEGDDVASAMLRKARELFATCDLEGKGFITRTEMQRLTGQLPLSADQLEHVFDSLDVDHNGYLTLHEFTDGFGSFVGVVPSGGANLQNLVDTETVLYQHSDDETTKYIASQGRGRYLNRRHEDRSRSHVDDDVDEADDLEQFHSEASETLKEVDGVRELWTRLRRSQPELLSQFEEFVQRVTAELKQSHSDCKSLETALRSKMSAHDDEVRRLYEEMEMQINAEKQRILNEEKARERQLKEQMDQELREKDRQLQELLAQHTRMQKKLEELNSQEFETKQENEKLQKEKEDLEDMLEESQRHLDESRSYINQLRQQQREEKRERALAALHVTEGIALERESLVRQLDMLRDMNKKLRDDRDEAELRRLMAENLQRELGEIAPGLQRSPSVASSRSSRSAALSRAESLVATSATGGCTPDADSMAAGEFPLGTGSLAELRQQQIARELALKRQQLTKRGSILSNYIGFPGPVRRRDTEADIDSDIELDDDEEDIEYDDNDADVSHISSPFITNDRECDFGHLPGDKTQPHRARTSGARRGISCDCSEAGNVGYDLRSAARQQPLGANSSIDQTDDYTDDEEVQHSAPERLFKVVFVGDSSVGKTSMIHRFCNNDFKPNFSATIGVDFQVKNIRIDGHVIALQMWDTAGQERFRSITKQYFRKADGVLVMYDVTSEQTFRNLRNWMSSVQDGTEPGTVILLVGNKTDLADDNSCPRAVPTSDGGRLAEEFGALFFETSAKSGLGVTESISAMTRMLREREDKDLERALQLTDSSSDRKRAIDRFDMDLNKQ